MSTKEKPCIEDPEYDYYKCIESYFYRQRGCQYPWNVYTHLNVPICTNYSEIKALLESTDPNMGYGREWFTTSERTTRTKMECPPPCHVTIYNLRFEKWNMRGSGKSLQIALSDFTIVTREEYLACDSTCVIGEIGGNLGFYLGGSLIFCLDIIIEYGSKILEFLCRRTKLLLCNF